MNNKLHWGGPVRMIDTSRTTPYIVIDSREKQAILKEIENKIEEKDLLNIFCFLRDREIVDIQFN